MDYLLHNVSENLKKIRKAKGISLDQVSEQTGVVKVCWHRSREEQRIRPLVY